MRLIRTQSGFTLVELVIVVFVLGAVSVIMSPAFKTLSMANQKLYIEEQNLINRKIASALLDYAKEDLSGDDLGTLPSPYTGGGYNNTVYNPANTVLATQLQETGIDLKKVNTDGTAAEKVRVYQKISLQKTVPFFGSTGPLVDLDYDFGAIYMTDCMYSEWCNHGIPGDREALTVSNMDTWPANPDTDGCLRPVFVSTLPMQKDLMRQTVDILNQVEKNITSYFTTKQKMADAGDQTNFFPAPTGGSAPDKSGQDPTSNQGCHDGWYNLYDPDVNVLEIVGLSREKYGLTPWDGLVEYCRDYEPDAADGSTEGEPPHYAAIRISEDLTANGAAKDPDGTDDIVVSF